MPNWINHNTTIRDNGLVFNYTQLNGVAVVDHLRKSLKSINIASVSGYLNLNVSGDTVNFISLLADIFIVFDNNFVDYVFNKSIVLLTA